MKIKKKEYQKQLADEYWKGVKLGMRFALDHPEDAKKHVDNIENMRRIVEKTSKAFEPLIEGIKKMAEQMQK